MSKPAANDSDVVNLSDDYIQNLKPENHRYDITLATDFVISVLPNGVKTWAFIYDFQGRNRRRTLGVFPDMNFAEAKRALEKSRLVMVRMDEVTVPPDEMGRRPAVLGGGKYIQKDAAQRPPWLLRALLVLVLIGIVGAGGFAWWKSSQVATPDADRGSTPDASRPFATTPEKTTSPKPGRLPFDVEPESTDSDTDKEKPPAPPPQSRTQTSGDRTTTATVGSPSARLPASSRNMDGSKDSESAGSNRSAKVGTAQQPTALISTRGTTEAAPQPASRSSPSSRQIAPAQGATALGGRVARSVLTSRMENLEPIDVLGPDITYKNSGFTRVFYFTELREFADGFVVHRWEHNGEVTDEVRLKVQKSWRWRTYSNKDITPGLSGQWRVSTIDGRGTVLDIEEFTYGPE